MPLNVEIKNADGYDRQLTEKLLDLTILQESVDNENQTKYISNNKILESIISSIKTKGSMKFTSNNNKDTVDLILSPYKHKGENVSVDMYGDFKDPENGLFVIKVRPEYGEIDLNKLPEYVTVCKRNHNYAFLRFPSTQVCSGVPLDVMVYIVYTHKVNVKEAIKEYTQLHAA